RLALSYKFTGDFLFFFSSRRRHTRSVSAFLLNRSSDLFLILKSGVNHTSRGSISTSTLPSIKLRKRSSKIITSILSFISGRLATKSNQIKQLIRNGRSEERRVGKECRSRWSTMDTKEKNQIK